MINFCLNARSLILPLNKTACISPRSLSSLIAYIRLRSYIHIYSQRGSHGNPIIAGTQRRQRGKNIMITTLSSSWREKRKGRGNEKGKSQSSSSGGAGLKIKNPLKGLARARENRVCRSFTLLPFGFAHKSADERGEQFPGFQLPAKKL